MNDPSHRSVHRIVAVVLVALAFFALCTGLATAPGAALLSSLDARLAPPVRWARAGGGALAVVGASLLLSLGSLIAAVGPVAGRRVGGGPGGARGAGLGVLRVRAGRPRHRGGVDGEPRATALKRPSCPPPPSTSWRLGPGPSSWITCAGCVTTWAIREPAGGGAAAPAYNASKAFVSNYLEGLRVRARKQNLDIAVTDVLPGFVDTAMAQGDGLFWVSPPQKAAKQIANAIDRRQSRIYVTKRWQIIAWALKLMPDWLYWRI